jgi:hypothetical protein
MAITNIAEIKLTRNQIKEIVGDDLRKVRVFETLINGSIIQDDILTVDPAGNPIAPIRTTRWANGRMEMYPVNPAVSTGGTVTFPVPFYIDTEKPIITSSGDLTISAVSQTAFTWTGSSAANMWRAIGRWKV